MRVLVISTLDIPIPSENYSPVAHVAGATAVGLRERGIETAIVARKGSTLDPPELLLKADGDERTAYQSYKDRLERYDFIIDMSHLKYSYMAKMEKPWLKILGVVFPCQVYSKPPPVLYPCLVGVSTSHAQHLTLRLKVPVEVCPVGVSNMAGSTAGGSASERDYALFFGRMVPDRGPHVALHISRKYRFPIILAGEDRVDIDQEFVLRLLRRCDGVISNYYGKVPERTKFTLMEKTKVLLLPYLTREAAFGCAVLKEAACSGLPVIAFNKGAVSEFITPEIGFVVRGVDEAGEAVGKALELDRERVAKSGIHHFNFGTTIDRILELLKTLDSNSW